MSNYGVCICFYCLLNICTSTAIKAIVMIVTDKRKKKSNIINCNNKSTIRPPPYVGGDTLLLSPISV